MAGNSSRPQRVADFLQRELAVLIQQQIRDPRISFVSVTGVEVSRDLTNAKVYVTFLNESDDNKQKERTERVKILNKAAGFLRSELSRSSSMRHMPQLRFYYDNSIERGSYMTDLIQKARRADDQNNLDNNEE